MRRNPPSAESSRLRRPLFQKYFVALFAAVAAPLLGYGGIEAWFGYRNYRTALDLRLQIEARAAAGRINDFLLGVREQMAWTVQRTWTTGTIDSHRLDALRLLRQTPAIAEVQLIDGEGFERVTVSRLGRDIMDSGIDRTGDPAIQAALSAGFWYGPVTFQDASEPFMQAAVAGNRRSVGVAVASINLKLIGDVITSIRVGESGGAFVADGEGQLIAHTDISFVLRGVDDQTRAWIEALRTLTDASAGAVETYDPARGAVLAASAPIDDVGWRIYAALPLAEAYAPIRATLVRTGAFLLAGAAFAALLALWLARRMTIPVRVVEQGVARIGGGDFDHRIRIATGDEIERLAARINDMAGDLATSKDRADRINRLKRFLSPQVAELIENAGTDEVLRPKHAEVVVVFFDLRGFTSFSAKADGETVFRVVSEYYEVLGEVIGAFEATLTHFSGDGVMAILNAPVPCTSPPRLVAARFACAADSAIQALLAKWRREGAELGFGAGFAAGLATVGRIGYADRYDYTAIGSVANLASRLCHLAGDGQILTDHSTAAGLGAEFEMTALGARNLKGFSNAVSVYTVRRRKEVDFL